MGDLMNTWVMVEAKDEITSLKALQKEIEHLKNGELTVAVKVKHKKLTAAVNGELTAAVTIN